VRLTNIMEGVKEALFNDANPNHEVINSFNCNPEYKEPILISAIIEDYELKPKFSESNRLEIVKSLLQAGGNPKAKDFRGVPALLLAFDKYPIAKLLLEYGADPNEIVTDDGKSILYCIHDRPATLLNYCTPLNKCELIISSNKKRCRRIAGRINNELLPRLFLSF
jgi:hypothetical protein